MPSKQTWSRNIDFLFACAGGGIGFGNVWRFPYICFANGGGAFLIPYLLAAAFFGFPLYFLEASLGQLTSGDIISLWKIVPLFKGIGFAAVVLNVYVLTYYIVILSWVARYLSLCFEQELPWTTCNNSWNTDNCITSNIDLQNQTEKLSNFSGNFSFSVEEFWENKVLRISKSISEIGTLNADLLICCVIMWLLVYFCIWKGIQWTSKIVYVTASAPFLLLFVMLVRGLTLDGASVGVSYYLKPNVTKLAEPQVWVSAVEQVCYSFLVGWGFIGTLAGHNKFHHNFYRVSLIIISLNIFTSFTSGFAVFSVLGFMAKAQNVSVAAVAKSGPGLAFIAYPQALQFLPLPQLWGVLFFTMMILIGLDSMFVAHECLVQTLFNSLPQKLKTRKLAYEIFMALFTFCLFLFSLCMVTEGGYHIFRMFEFASSGWCLITVVTLQAIALGWVVGTDRYFRYVTLMLKKELNVLIWIKICWKYIIPLSGVILVVFSWTKLEYLKYPDKSPYPAWAIAVAWMMALSSMILIPGYAIYHFLLQKGTWKQKMIASLAVREPTANLKLAKNLSVKREETEQAEHFISVL